MQNILDIHTHHAAPQPDAVIALTPENFNPIPGQLYSVGIHPWDTMSPIPARTWDLFEEAARHPQTVAIGECGIDLVKGGPLYIQMQTMKRQAELAENLGKPLILHNVHGQEIIIGMKKDIKPEVPWLVHGFRSKPTIATMLLDAGFWFSFNNKFNEKSLALIPLERLLAETDDEDCTIQEVITTLSSLRGQDLKEIIISNSATFLNSSK